MPMFLPLCMDLLLRIWLHVEFYTVSDYQRHWLAYEHYLKPVNLSGSFNAKNQAQESKTRRRRKLRTVWINIWLGIFKE